MRRILVPTDFSDSSRQAIRCALALTVAVEGDLLLLHVVEGDPLPRYVVGDPPDLFPPWAELPGRLLQGSCSPIAIYHDRCEEARWKLASLLPSGCPERFRPMVTVGKVAEEIVSVAQGEQADLILLGIHGRRRWCHVLWPTVPAQVMRRTSIPVMTLRTVGHCPLPSQGRYAGAWPRIWEAQPWPDADEPEHGVRWRNSLAGEVEDTELHVPHGR
jgi:nucleotide-binding universal stress UspA family protein